METTKRITCKLTPEELNVEAKKLTDLNVDIINLEESKRACNVDYKQQIDHAKEEIEDLVKVIASGYKERLIRCNISFNDPKDGMKTIARIDNGEIIEIVPMDDEESSNIFINQCGDDAAHTEEPAEDEEKI